MPIFTEYGYLAVFVMLLICGFGIPVPEDVTLVTGGVIAGVVGQRRFTYDIWGDAVNIAARVESAGEPGRINVSEEVYGRTRQYFEFTERGAVEVKNKAPLKMYFLDRLKPDFAADKTGLTMNDRLRQLLHPAV